MTSAVITSIEPPGLAVTAVDTESAPVMEVRLSLIEGDGTTRSASVTLPGNATDVDIAFAMVNCLHGCAAMRGRGLYSAVQRWVPTQ